MNAFQYHESDPAKVRDFHPVNKNLLILLDITKQSSASGLILIPTIAQSEQCTGLVVHADPDIAEDFGIKPGVRVLLDSSRGTIIHANTKNKRTFVCYGIDDIIATMED